MKLFKFSFLLLSVIFFQSCNTVKDMKSSDLGGKWVLKTLNGQSSGELFTGKIPTLEFDINKNSISGTGGCNNYSGSYKLIKNQFSAPNLASTLMMCPSPNEEGAFTKALSTPSDIAIKGGELVFAQNGKTTLVFEKAKPLSVEDLSGAWTLHSIEGATANILFEGKIPTINFDATTKRITGNSGCNSYNGTFEFSKKTLDVGRLMGTRKACPGNMEGEKKFMGLLTGTSEINLEDGMLTLRRDGKHLLSFTKTKE